jgi:hypothetical protein
LVTAPRTRITQRAGYNGAAGDGLPKVCKLRINEYQDAAVTLTQARGAMLTPLTCQAHFLRAPVPAFVLRGLGAAHDIDQPKLEGQ